MATWITHIRIAEYFMNINENLNNIDFLVGNIAPDCNALNEDKSCYAPDKNITHWKVNGDNRSEDFKNKYVKRENAGFNFYLGYYFHLLTDNLWKYHSLKGIKIVEGSMTPDENLSWEEIKKDWHGQDYLFLKNNPDFIFYKTFIKIEEYPNRFFDFCLYDIFTKLIKKASDFYLNKKDDGERRFLYLSESEIDSFVNSTIIKLEKIYQAI